MSFEELITSQYDLGSKIEALARNFPKDSRDRKTPEYYAKKLQTLTELADKFYNNNEAIMALTDKPMNDTYFTQGYYEHIRTIIVKHIQIFEKGGMELVEPGSGNGSNALQNESELRKILRNQRALMTALTKSIDDILAKRDTPQPTSYYNIKAQILEKYMIDLTKNNAALWALTNDDTVENYTLQTYYELAARTEEAMIELQQHMPIEPSLRSSSPTPPKDNDVRLPRITIPKFDGNYHRWMEFKDLFLELIHNTTLSEAKKMHYLTTSLEGEPRNLIKHLPAVGTNYATAWSIISSRYDNKRLLVSTLLNKLMTQSSIKKESAATLKSLHDVTKECIHGLKAQGIPVQHWDAILAHIVLRRMDTETLTIFEQGLNDNRRLVTIDEVLKFLERRFQSFEARGKGEPSATKTCASATKSNSSENCKICNKEPHKTYMCKTFTGAELDKKWKWVKDLSLCVNCLSPGHKADKCKSRSCTKCNKNHNSLLHNPKTKPPNVKKSSQDSSNSTSQSATSKGETAADQSSYQVSLLTNSTDADEHYVLLGTARIKLIAANGQRIECKAVLDSGSQVNLITERLLKKLGGQLKPISMSLEGVGANETKMRHQTTITIQSTLNDFATELTAHVLPKIVSNQPMQLLQSENWGIPHGLRLADPDFNKPGRIDCLIGAELFFDLLTEGQIKLSPNLPVLQNSKLGWIVAGKVETSSSNKAVCGICTTKELEHVISKFWEIEDIPDNKVELTEDELHCESHFLQHTHRANDGRFVVKLPLKSHPSVLAESKGIAYERFKSIERRLMKDSSLKEQYVSFMREYEQLGHMTQTTMEKVNTAYYFIPHHCVLRPESTSTKLRVVFDASARKPPGMSLNDIMFNGPTVQSELFSLLLRFRMPRYVLKTDIEKMYRQIWVDETDRNLQLIMWRESCDQPIKIFKLSTVTYGTRAAPYLATRCLIQLADECKGQFPYGAAALKRDFYVDDGLTGADTIHEALLIQEQLIKILSGAGMKLKKWCANDPKLLSGIAIEDQEVNLNFDLKDDPSTKTLGLMWLPKSDVFGIKASIRDHHTATKRTMSSDLAHIYDPLGLIGPVLVTGKIQLQKTWQSKLDWDEELPSEIQKQWEAYKKDLCVLNNITIPRHIFSKQEYVNVELHAFADASEKAYGAAVYIRAIQKDKSIKINLLCSKSRVAPIKAQTIPRLELCAALLAAELITRVKADLGYQDKAAHMWTDSQIVLSWINNHPGNLPVFVAHRVVKILRVTITDQWRHVPSKQNPADILSRGLKPREFSSANMWLYGPLFLYQPKALWPAPFKKELSIEHTIESTAVVALETHHPDTEASFVYSIHSKNSFIHVQKVVGYVLRFIRNAKRPKNSRSEHISLSPMELDAALKLIVREIQTSDFLDVKKMLHKDKFVPKTHNLSSLTPFLDDEGLIRVGGRLSSSTQQFDATHQMILPSNDPLVKLLMEKIHKDHFHCGAQALLAQMRQRFWPLKGKSLARSVVQRCVKCTRARPNFYNQIMGNLPSHRVQPARAFLNSGVDYCGPFSVRFGIRGRRPQKAYIAVFCCFATKAVHLELVTNLTTEAFLGALKRFIARRGHCRTLYCDNATNFVGARNQLQELDEIIYSKTAQESIINTCSNKGIEFRFIPPRSPHFGGLWEAAVKSAKHLLMKNVSKASLTYEEFETVVVEIEAMLNSRPLIPSSSDANDLNAITPGHFLIGEELSSSVDVHAQDPKRRLLERWQLVSELKHNFWERWSKEYLNELQQKHKWKGPVIDITPNTMVIIKEDNTPVLQWPLGRIIKTYKGEDGLVRVCDIKTQKGIFKRPINRLAPLFPEEEVQQKPEEQNRKRTSSPSLPISIPLDRIKDISMLDTERTSAKRPRCNSSLLFAIVTLLLLPLVLGNNVNITKLGRTPGIYFEELGTVKLKVADWKVVVYFDLEPYQEQMGILSDGTATLQKLCDQASNHTACTFLLKYFDDILDEMQLELNFLTVKRSKRGAIDFVGNIANSLFGVLDSNYAAQMSETITNLKKNDDHLEELFKKQTSLIDSTINIVKKNQKNVQAKFDEIDNQIHKLLYSNRPINDIQVTQNILTLSVQMLMIVSNLQHIQSSMMDVLIDSHHDKLNPLLLSPRQLNEEILKIKAHLPPHLHLPIHQGNLLEVYKLIKVNGVIAERHVIFNIDLPLTDPRELQLYHLIPIVAALNTTLSTVKLSTNFLAISQHRDEFVPMLPSEVKACLTLSETELLCPNIQAIYQVSAQPLVSKCEIDLFNEQENPRCEIFELEDTTVWFQLHSPNKWIFSTLNTIRLIAVCHDDTIQLTLEASGLITLRPDCIIKNDLITIQGRQQIITSIQTSLRKVSPTIGWAKQYNNNNFSVRPFNLTIPELEVIQQKLANLSLHTDSTIASTLGTHSIITSYTSIALVLIVICSIMYKWKSLTRKFTPTALPRNQSTPTALPRNQSTINTDC